MDNEDSIFFDRINGDSRRYLQILVNFVNNAVKFSKQGGKVSVIAEVKNVLRVKMPFKDRPNSTIVESFIESESSYSSAPDKEVLEEEKVEEQKQFNNSSSLGSCDSQISDAGQM